MTRDRVISRVGGVETSKVPPCDVLTRRHRRRASSIYITSPSSTRAIERRSSRSPAFWAPPSSRHSDPHQLLDLVSSPRTIPAPIPGPTSHDAVPRRDPPPRGHDAPLGRLQHSPHKVSGAPPLSPSTNHTLTDRTTNASTTATAPTTARRSASSSPSCRRRRCLSARWAAGSSWVC